MPEICCPSLDEAWLRAVQAACNSQGHEVSPLTVTFDAARQEPTTEFAGLRSALNKSLEVSDCATVETVANTLFPYSLWNPAGPRGLLFKRYLNILPILRHDSRNRRGLYFERLISYPDSRTTAAKNQLDHIIQTFASGNHRRSALQAAVFYPPADLNHARQQGFPCLHQIAFAHNQARGTLTVTGFYAMQYLFERAYGNYLGLARLGEFMAREMNLELERVVCIAAVAKLEVAAGQVQPLLSHFLPPSQIGSERRSART
jgi:hypothetical protein